MRKLVWALVITLLVLAGIAGFWFLFGQKAVCGSAPQEVQDAAKNIFLAARDGARQDYDKRLDAYNEALNKGNETNIRLTKLGLDMGEALLNDSEWFVGKLGGAPQRSIELLVAGQQVLGVNAVSIYEVTKQAREQKDAGTPIDLKGLSDLVYADSIKSFGKFDLRVAEDVSAGQTAASVSQFAGGNALVGALANVCASEIGRGAAQYVEEYLEYARTKAEAYRNAGEYAKAALYELNAGIGSLSLGQAKTDIEKEYPSLWDVHYKRLQNATG